MRGNAGAVFNIGQTAGNLFELLVADEFIAQKIAVRPGRNHKEGGSASPQEGDVRRGPQRRIYGLRPQNPFELCTKPVPLLPQ